MNEPRRIEMIPAVGVNLEKNKTKTMPTIRLVLSLTETTDDTYPEFSYVELCKNTEDNHGSLLDPEDPFAAQEQADHDKMVAIAKGFESKYGGGHHGRRKDASIEDFIDLGEGYEEDSFVDNSEAYDELVPSTMRTKFGGFYINTGELDFVPVDDQSGDVQLVKKKIKKRKVIESEDEENGAVEKKKKAPKVKENGSEEPVKKKRKKIIPEEGKRCKGPPGRVLKSEKCRTVAEFLNEINNTSTPTVTKPAEPSQNLPLSPIRKALTPSTEKVMVSSPTPAVRSVTIPVDPRDHRVNDKDVTNEAKVESVASKIETGLSKLESSIDAVILQSLEDVATENLKNGTSELPTTLTGSFSAELNRSVERMKELALAGKVTSDESSTGQRFTSEAQQLLIEIHDGVAKLSSSDRTAVVNYLGVYFPSGKEGLIKRLKKLDLTLHGDQLKQPIAKLKDAIQAVMPSLIEKHRVEVSAKEKLRMDQLQEQREKKEVKDGTTVSDSDDDEENRDTVEKQRRIMAPRKKFEWNEEIRKLLCRVVDIKMEHFEMSKIRSQTPEEYLKSFLEAEIKPLWPSGWIQTRMLFKESRSSHFRWTCNTQRAKKNVLVTPKTSTPIVSTPLDTSDVGPGHQMSSMAPFCTPVAIPNAKQKPLLDDSLASNLVKEPRRVVMTAVTNGSKDEHLAEPQFTSINSKSNSVVEVDLTRNDARDPLADSDVTIQKLRRGLLSKSPITLPMTGQEMETSAQRSLASRTFPADKEVTVTSTADTSSLRVINISSSTGSDTSSVTTAKSEGELGVSSICENGTEKKESNCTASVQMPGAVQVPGTVQMPVATGMSAQGYLDAFLNFSASSAKKAASGTDEDQKVSSTRPSSLLDRSCDLKDSAHSLISQVLEAYLSDRSAAGKTSLTSAGPECDAKFTEMRSLQRQSSCESANKQVSMSTSFSRKSDAGGLDLSLLMAPPASHKVPDVSTMQMRQDAVSMPSQGSLPLSPRSAPKVLHLMPPALPKSTLSGSPVKWVSRPPSSSVSWTSPVVINEKQRSTSDFIKLESGSHLTKANVLLTVASGGLDAAHASRDFTSKPVTSRAPALTDSKTVAVAVTSRSNAQTEGVAKSVTKSALVRQTSQTEESKKVMRSAGLSNEEAISQVMSALFATETVGRHSVQGINKPATTDSSHVKFAVPGQDHSRAFQGKSATSTTSAAVQSLWQPSDKQQATALSFCAGTNLYGSGLIVGQQPSGPFGDRSTDYGQHQPSKLPPSIHDHQQKPDNLMFSGTPLQNSNPLGTVHPRQPSGFYNSGGQRPVLSSQRQTSAAHVMQPKTDSQPAQHQFQ